MPVTKTAKRALRSSKKKALVNTLVLSQVEIAVRLAKKSKKTNDVNKAYSLLDRAVKKHIIHKNKASRLKSKIAFVPNTKKVQTKTSKKTSKK